MIKAKDVFRIMPISKQLAYKFVSKNHYLGKAKFFSCVAYGLFMKDTYELVGVATFSQPQGIVALKGWFGLDNSNTDIYELSRLCMLPILNGTNATSFLLGGSIKRIKRDCGARAVISLADSNRHVGSIYQVCNFKYYGLTDKKSDFYGIDGTKNPRGAVRNVHGVWLERTRKHRYCYLIDKSLKVNYSECDKPKPSDKSNKICCNGSKKVFDKRFNEWFTCPICTGALMKIDNEVDLSNNE